MTALARAAFGATLFVALALATYVPTSARAALNLLAKATPQTSPPAQSR